MKSDPNDWVQASAARTFDPEAKAGEEWTAICAAAAAIMQETTPPPLAVPIDPAAFANQEHPSRQWGLGESVRLRFALILLDLFERRKFTMLARIAERLERIQAGDNTAPDAATLALLEVAERAAKNETTFGKTDLREELERSAPNTMPHSKKGWWTRYKEWGWAGFRPRR